METVGLLSLVLVGVGALAAVAIVAVSVPDIARYRRLRKM
jgi:hypothetical protein